MHVYVLKIFAMDMELLLGPKNKLTKLTLIND